MWLLTGGNENDIPRSTALRSLLAARHHGGDHYRELLEAERLASRVSPIHKGSVSYRKIIALTGQGVDVWPRIERRRSWNVGCVIRVSSGGGSGRAGHGTATGRGVAHEASDASIIMEMGKLVLIFTYRILVGLFVGAGFLFILSALVLSECGVFCFNARHFLFGPRARVNRAS